MIPDKPIAAPDDPPDRPRDYLRRAREVRKVKLRTQLGEHLKGIEEFFDHYAPIEEKWRRNTEYRNQFLAPVKVRQLFAAKIWRLQLAQFIVTDACALHGVRE